MKVNARELIIFNHLEGFYPCRGLLLLRRAICSCCCSIAGATFSYQWRPPIIGFANGGFSLLRKPCACEMILVNPFTAAQGPLYQYSCWYYVPLFSCFATVCVEDLQQPKVKSYYRCEHITCAMCLRPPAHSSRCLGHLIGLWPRSPFGLLVLPLGLKASPPTFAHSALSACGFARYLTLWVRVQMGGAGGRRRSLRLPPQVHSENYIYGKPAPEGLGLSMKYEAALAASD